MKLRKGIGADRVKKGVGFTPLQMRGIYMLDDVRWIKFRDETGKCVGAIARGEDDRPRLFGRYTDEWQEIRKRRVQ